MKIIQHVHSEDFKTYQTDKIRERFLLDGLKEKDKANFVYAHYDRMVTGLITPTKSAVALGTYDILRADYFLERREMGVINVGGTGTIEADGTSYELAKLDCLYMGKGVKDVKFSSKNPDQPAVFYILSAPAHQTYPTTFLQNADAFSAQLGSVETANERRIIRYIHKDGIQSCQLVMGLTILSVGSVWNTIPPHTHDRRMEVYFYFDVDEEHRVFHYMGEPQETRHIIVANHEAVLSPTWSIHAGSGTKNYSFIWGMAGENLDYADMDTFGVKELEEIAYGDKHLAFNTLIAKRLTQYKMEQSFSLKDKVIVVTGGTGILGNSFVNAIVEAGGAVGILGRNAEIANERADAINKNGGKAIALIADAMDEDQLIAARTKIIAAFGKIDGLVNAAGGNMPDGVLQPEESVFKMKMDGMKKVLDLNLWGTLIPTQIFGEAIAETGRGSIVNISSMNSKKAVTKVLGYNMGKAAVDCYTQWFAVELANRYGDKIRMNALAPGFFLTEQNRNLLTVPGGGFTPRGQSVIKQTPFKRFGDPDELKGALVWLLSDASQFVTGAMICVDGGFSIFSGV